MTVDNFGGQMQNTMQNAFMGKRKPQINFLVDAQLRDAWLSYAKEKGSRRGSTLGTAAIIGFWRLPPAQRASIIREVIQAEFAGQVASLIPNDPTLGMSESEPENAGNVAGAIGPQDRLKAANAKTNKGKKIK